MNLLFVFLVVMGFLFLFLATFPVPYASRIGWGCLFGASLLWALPQFGASL